MHKSKHRYFYHIFVSPWGRPWGSHAKCCMDGKRIRCLQIVSQHVPIYLQHFHSYSTRKCKKSPFSRTASHIFVSPGDAPVIITQYVTCYAIVILISPGDCTLQCGMCLWDHDSDVEEYRDLEISLDPSITAAVSILILSCRSLSWF